MGTVETKSILEALSPTSRPVTYFLIGVRATANSCAVALAKIELIL